MLEVYDVDIPYDGIFWAGCRYFRDTILLRLDRESYFQNDKLHYWRQGTTTYKFKGKLNWDWNFKIPFL